MTPAVVDASVAGKWFLANQPLGAEAHAARSNHAFIAPTLLLVELSNALWKYVRTGALELDAAQESVSLVAAEVRLIADKTLLRTAQRLSAELDHPIYDCLYASLAQREGVPLITADGKLARKFGGVLGLQLIELSAYAERR